MAIPWLIGAAVVGIAAYALSDSDSDSSSSSDDLERAQRRAEEERKQKEKEQVALQAIAKLEQATDLLMNSYGVDEFQALRFLHPEEEVEYVPENLLRNLNNAEHELSFIKKALNNLKEIENEL